MRCLTTMIPNRLRPFSDYARRNKGIFSFDFREVRDFREDRGDVHIVYWH